MNVAVVGCGYWGPNLIRNLGTMGDVQLTVCDLNKERVNKIKAAYPTVKTSYDFEEVLRDSEITAVVISTPAKTHYELTKRALEKGKSVLVEKPLAFTSAEAEELVGLSKKQNKILMVGHTFEYNPAVIKLKEYIDTGELGKVYYAYSSRLNLGQIREDVNAMWNLAPHDISILIYLFGSLPQRVSAVGKAFVQNDIEDVVFVTLEFAGKIMAHVHISWLDPSKIRRMTVVGDKKMVIYDDVDNEARLKIYDKGITKSPNSDAFGEYFIKLRSGDIYIPKIDLQEPLKIEVSHFIECLKENKTPKTDGENGLRVIKTLEAAQYSLKNEGVFVDLK
ncbi:MAG: Gfo/Idh/MocA family oxidoreductase [Candidatus Omnitrophota bacterium]